MIHLNIGRRRQGKTTLAWKMAERVPQRLVWDSRRQIGHGTRFTEVTAFVEACDTLAALPVGSPETPLDTVVYTPSGDLEAGFADFSRECERWIADMPTRPLAIIVDEASADQIDTNIASFQRVLRECRPELVHVILTVHRPVDLTTKVRALADHWCLFAIRQEQDLDVIIKRCDKDVARIVQQLGPREFVWWDDTITPPVGDTAWKRYSNPRDWYVQLHPGTTEPASIARPAGLEDLPVTSRIDTSRLF